jgi:thiol-disulfide isomerase/thioredoxin
MPTWLRTTLYLLMLLSCVIIGVRVYLEFSQAEPPAATGIPADNEPAVSEPTTLPEFTLNDVWGEPHSISEWAGEPMLINFWATWCAPCRREMPLLQNLHNERGKTGVQIIGVAIDRQPDVQSYITEAGISYPILVGESDAIAVTDLFYLPGLGLPFSVLVAADGSILTVYLGELVTPQLAEMVTVSQKVATGQLNLASARDRLDRLAELGPSGPEG